MSAEVLPILGLDLFVCLLGVSVKEVQGDTKKWELLKNPTKIEEIQEKNIY